MLLPTRRVLRPGRLGRPSAADALLSVGLLVAWPPGFGMERTVVVGLATGPADGRGPLASRHLRAMGISCHCRSTERPENRGVGAQQPRRCPPLTHWHHLLWVCGCDSGQWSFGRCAEHNHRAYCSQVFSMRVCTAKIAQGQCRTW